LLGSFRGSSRVSVSLPSRVVLVEDYRVAVEEQVVVEEQAIVGKGKGNRVAVEERVKAHLAY